MKVGQANSKESTEKGGFTLWGDLSSFSIYYRMVSIVVASKGNPADPFFRISMI